MSLRPSARSFPLEGIRVLDLSRPPGRLAAGPTRAYAAIKATLETSAGHSLAEQLELEGKTIQTLTTTRDFAEGVAAFGERRSAEFAGD